MDEELIILGEEQIEEVEIDIEDMEQIIEQEEMVEIIEVEEPEEIEIEIEEAIGWTSSNGDVTHYSLPDRYEKDQHIIESITDLRETLNTLASTKNVYAKSGGFAELRLWADNVKTKDPGYFVSLVQDEADGNNYIEICNPDTDVYGVTVFADDVGFYGYQDTRYDEINREYNILNNSTEYAKVCILGNVKVRISEDEYLKVNVGDYVVPNNLGCASARTEDGDKYIAGYKVTSKGSIGTVGSDITAWYYVGISLVPQNDNVNRIVEELGSAQANLENVTIQLGKDFDSVQDGFINVSGKVDGFEDVLNETTGKVTSGLAEAEKVVKEAKDEVKKANDTIMQVQGQYSEAVSRANDALEQVSEALVDISELQNTIEPLASWTSEDGSYGVAGFVAQANEDHTQLGSMVKAFGDKGIDVAAIIQKIDENGAAIQHIVAHVDKYTLGTLSPTNGLSPEEAEFLQAGHIYIPTESHSEDGINVDTHSIFEVGKYYEWSIGDAPEKYTWVDRGDVYMWVDYDSMKATTESFDKDDNGALWYCDDGILQDNKFIYTPDTLYCWDNGKRAWVQVALANDGTSNVIGMVDQTTKKLVTTYTNLKSDITSITQKVDEIDLLVKDLETGAFSDINQTAEHILMGVYEPGSGSTSLELLLEGVTNTSVNTEVIMAKYVLDKHSIPVGDRYEFPPNWDGEKFVFAESDKAEDGTYYFDSTNQTYYCEDVKDGYKVWRIGNVAMASLNSRVTDAESEIGMLTNFKTDTSETLTTLTQKTDANSAEIASVAAGEYVVCTEINLEPTEEQLAQIPTIRYTNPPTWEVDKFVFDKNDENSDGLYYMLEDDFLYYYKLNQKDGNIISYEQYEIASSGSATIIQKVTNNSSTIGMVVDNVGEDGKVTAASIIASINKDESSEATINADKINLQGYVTVESLIGNGTTTINGSNITTGVIQSGNYTESLEGNIFAQEGTRFDLANGSINSKNFNLSVDGDASITGKITATSGYIGNEVNGFVIEKTPIYKYTVGSSGLEAYNYYFEIDGVYYCFTLDEDMVLVKDDEITLNLLDSIIIITGSKELTLGVTTASEKPSGLDYIPLDCDDISFYCLSNDQLSLNGDESGLPGVYVAPDGIGLGNGNFYVDNNGDIAMNGSITMDGNMIIGGNITFTDNGRISWDNTNSPVKALYSTDSIYPPGTDGYSSSLWHNKYEDDDKYVCYSYDGGSTWTIPIKIKGEDGRPGTSETVDYSRVKTILSNTYSITSTTVGQATISAPIIEAATLYSGDIYGATITTVDVDDADSAQRIVIDSDGLTSYNDKNELHGLVSHPSTYAYNDGFSLYNRGDELFRVARFQNDLSVYFFGYINGVHQEFAQMRALAGSGMYVTGDWKVDGSSTVDFSGAKVKGLKITFG